MFDAQDRLYIASVVGRELVIMEPRSGRIIDRLGPDDGVETPDDLTFGPDGSVYWTSLLTGVVGRRTPAGQVTTQFVAPGVNPITFSDDGRLFVALDFLGDGLYELDPELVDPPRPIVVSTPTVPLPLGFMNGMDWGPDGRLYGPIWTQARVVSIDVDSCENTSDPYNDCDIQTVATVTGVAAAVKFDPWGRLHTIDQATGEVLRIDGQTGETTTIAQLTPGLDNLAFNSRGELYVSHSQDGSIVEVHPNGGARTVSRTGLIAPGGIAVLPGPKGRDALWVGDLFALREFDGLTGLQASVTRGLLGVSELSELVMPLSVSADGDKLVTTSWFDSAVQVWDPVAGEAVMTYHGVPAPLNAIGFQGDLAVAQLATGSVVRASDSFELAGELFIPTGLAADGDDNLFVADWATGMVWKYTSPSERELVAGGLAFPEGLALDADGSLLVVETGIGQLSRIDPATGAVIPVAQGLALGAPGPVTMPPTWIFNAVAVGEEGAIYVTGDISNVIYRIEVRP